MRPLDYEAFEGLALLPDSGLSVQYFPEAPATQHSAEIRGLPDSSSGQHPTEFPSVPCPLAAIRVFESRSAARRSGTQTGPYCAAGPEDGGTACRLRRG